MSSQATMAGPQALGYLYQSRLALYLILKSTEETDLSLERFDDIAFEEDACPKELLQLKHHTEKKASLTDYSSDLWKTIRGWSLNIKGNKISLTETLLTLITTSRAPDGSIASLLRPDINRNSELACQKLLRTAQTSTNKALEGAFEVFLEMNSEQRKMMVNCIYVLDQSPNISDTADKIKSRIEFAVYKEHLDGVFERLEGWWFDKVVRHLSVMSAEPIARFEVHDKIIEISDQFRPDALPIDFLDKEPPSTLDPERDERIFVLQLKEIDVNYRRIEKAILDYYRAFEQRSRWAREDLLVGEEIEKYEKRLIDEWERFSLALQDEASKKEVSEDELRRIGREVYKWVEQIADFRIRPRVTEPYVIRGSYQILADKNPPDVRWHPEFLERLQAILKID